MKLQDIHEFGLGFSYHELLKMGFEVLSVEPDLETFPQIIARKDEQLYFIVVQTDVYPLVGDLPTTHQIKQLRAHAEKHHALAKFISLGIANGAATNEEEKSNVKKESEILVNFSGLKELFRLGDS